MESTVVASKEQELKALAQIRKIVKGLGPQSYIGTAMTGVWEIAEENIDFDAAISFPESIDQLREELAAAKKERDGYKSSVESLKTENERLADTLDAELEWKPCDGGTNMAQADYEKLAQACEAETLTDQQAKKLIADEFGFDPAKVTVFRKGRHLRSQPAPLYARGKRIRPRTRLQRDRLELHPLQLRQLAIRNGQRRSPFL